MLNAANATLRREKINRNAGIIAAFAFLRRERVASLIRGRDRNDKLLPGLIAYDCPLKNELFAFANHVVAHRGEQAFVCRRAAIHPFHELSSIHHRNGTRRFCSAKPRGALPVVNFGKTADNF